MLNQLKFFALSLLFKIVLILLSFEVFHLLLKMDGSHTLKSVLYYTVSGIFAFLLARAAHYFRINFFIAVLTNFLVIGAIYTLMKLTLDPPKFFYFPDLLQMLYIHLAIGLGLGVGCFFIGNLSSILKSSQKFF